MNAETAAMLAEKLSAGAFQKFLGLQLAAYDAEAATISLRAPWRIDFERGPGSGQWHGGVIAAILDIAGDFALIARLGRGVPTIDLRVDYLRPAIATDLVAHARALRVGRSIGTVDVELRDKTDALVATGRGTYATADRGAGK
ncbi:MAG: PaaI family thioesterase [Proteobacteria bacterium]|nr:PaaI family thioesterase [Pseudomonadota bacterium]